MRKKANYFLLFLLLGWTAAMAQNAGPQARTITGKVLAGVDHQPLPGASVTVQGTHTIATTDGTGIFNIKARTGDVLVITATGFQAVNIWRDCNE